MFPFDEEVTFELGVVEVGAVEVVVVVVVDGVDDDVDGVVVVVVVVVLAGVGVGVTEVTGVDGVSACVVHWPSTFSPQLFDDGFHWNGKSQVMHYPLTS